MCQHEGYPFAGACFEVDDEQTYGLGEEIDQENLEIELSLRNLPFQSKQGLIGTDKGHELTKRCFPDLFVGGGLVIELRAVTQLATEQEAQLMNYLRLTRQPVGYLANFGPKDNLERKRFLLSEFIPNPLASISAD